MKEELKVPPHDADIERNILGAITLNPNNLPIVISKLSEELFYDDKHKLIFRAICDLYDNSRTIDIATVVHQLKENNNLESIGGPYEVIKIENGVTSFASIETHICILIELYAKRKTIEVGRKMVSDGYEMGTDVFDLLNECSNNIFKVQEGMTRGEQTDMLHYVMKVAENRDRIKTTGQIGIDTGFKTLNEAISGYVNPDLVIIAARPGMGKTAMIISSIHHMAVVNKIPLGVFSLEMSGEQLTNRILSIDSGIDHQALRTNTLNDHEREILAASEGRVCKAPIYIDETSAINIRELRTKAHLFKRKYDVKCLFVDYLQLMSGIDERNKSRENVISEISRGCKAIAKELDIPVIALSQLSRAVEQRSDRMPQLSDLRESGSIEQDADEVIFLMRPEYYGMTEPVRISGIEYNVNGLVICKIDKNRHGATKNIPLRFEAEKMKYSDYTTPF